MDEIVKAAIAKWPNVPDVYGWLGLDLRGDWWLRDARAQSAGRFPVVKGSRIEHERLKAFIGRNYEHDARGCWYFQNGPQRVYVSLEAAPWVWRVSRAPDDSWTVASHTGAPAQVESAWADDDGRLLLGTDLGLGSVHPQDMDAAADAIEAGTWQPVPAPLATLLARFGVVREPRPEAG
jgi:hypothetical protein